MDKLKQDAVGLLKKLISTPSISRDETGSGDLIYNFLKDARVKNISRHGNNIWVYNRYFDNSKPTILLNSHHDTVPASISYSRDPFTPCIEDGKLYGLGSNDAGGSLVALLSVFRYIYDISNLKYNICIALTAEEEVSGSGGIESIIPQIGEIAFAIVGEPTEMQMAVAERGLIVMDCTATGKSGHAARDEGENAIYKAIKDIEWFHNYRFEKISPLLGEVKTSVTIINGGTKHNVVPDICSFCVDIRVNECYTNAQIVDIIKEHVSCNVVPRSLRLTSSSISLSHPIVVAGKSIGLTYFGSPTMSDQALLSVPSIKIGVGSSSRSHIADEYVYLQEIYDGIDIYINLLSKIIK